ncbi:Shedu anti-phage system protein SduA domain-containing protein [Lysinibacillus sp. KU-BSD001]|uniref:ATP-binding protein n=1 Tax=Lysinibacillus sp. KU-BSD001 TaxID=3141328 RepID=UPI0036E32AE9
MTILQMSFDLKTIDHLGVKLYNTFPPVIAELVSNSYDADAENVKIFIDYENKSAKVEDDGHGMTLDEINNQFLVIGRNRRLSENSSFSRKKKRKVTGKKGLGKLAVFGITEEIVIHSVAKNLKNSFSMNYSDIKTVEDSTYFPKEIHKNIPVTDEIGTTIELNKIRQKTITDIHTLAEGLSSRFQIFDSEFNVEIINVNTGESETVTNETFHSKVDFEFSWNFPEDFSSAITSSENLKWLNEKEVTGKILTTPTPLKESHKGIIIYARKKLVQEKTFFNDRSNDFFNTYATGYFIADFIDDSNSEDIISTDRKSILWDSNDELRKLKIALDEVVRNTSTSWRTKRDSKRKDEIKNCLPKDFYDDMTKTDKSILKNVERQLLTKLSSANDTFQAANLLQAFKHQFKFESFKDYVEEMHETEITIENMEKLSSDWEKIEINEMAKLALGRVKTIQSFEEFINGNASETKVIQPFLEKFPWILEPRMSVFDREVTFKKILKENFPDEELQESNRRIDFLCSNVNGDVVIIELKRPNIKLSSKEISQARKYERFLLEKRQNQIKSIKTYLISDRYDMDEEAKDMYESHLASGKLFIKTYTELIDQAKQYHKHFIEMQEDINSLKSEMTAAQTQIQQTLSEVASTDK